MSVWPLVNKLRILQGSIYNLFDFMELEWFFLWFFLVFWVFFEGWLVEECDCAYVTLAQKGICHVVPCGYELLQPPARGFAF